MTILGVVELVLLLDTWFTLNELLVGKRTTMEQNRFVLSEYFEGKYFEEKKSEANLSQRH